MYCAMLLDYLVFGMLIGMHPIAYYKPLIWSVGMYCGV